MTTIAIHRSLPRIRRPRRAAIIAWTCGPLFAAQLLLLSAMLTR